jgi:very-short-patch-repair endonuclease
MGSDNLMLIAIMNNGRDLSIAKAKHWYRIPFKSAPKRLEEVNYIAFYQTKAFGHQKWSINYWSEMKSCGIVKRSELLPHESDHPRANDRYYKIEMGELKQLPKPILSKRGRRLVFTITTLEKFRKAEEINDLFNESPLEDRLWDELKKDNIEAERQYYVAEEKGKYCLDFAIFCEKGNIDVECNGDKWHSQKENIAKDNKRNNFLASKGWSVLRFSTREIDDNMPDCLYKLKETINRFGGISNTDGSTQRFHDSSEESQLELFGELDV